MPYTHKTMLVPYGDKLTVKEFADRVQTASKGAIISYGNEFVKVFIRFKGEPSQRVLAARLDAVQSISPLANWE